MLAVYTRDRQTDRERLSSAWLAGRQASNPRRYSSSSSWLLLLLFLHMLLWCYYRSSLKQVEKLPSSLTGRSACWASIVGWGASTQNPHWVEVLLRLGPHCEGEIDHPLTFLHLLLKMQWHICHGCASVHHGLCLQHRGGVELGFGKWGVCWWWCSIFGMDIVVMASSSRGICFCVGGIVYSQSGSAWWVQVASPCLVPRDSGCGAASHTGSSRHCHPCGLLHSLDSNMSRWATQVSCPTRFKNPTRNLTKKLQFMC